MKTDIPSFERFNYLLRTNKHIERKLVFDLICSASKRLNFHNHWYLGFGSMWFGDFRLADRLLGIEKMISIELEEYAERALFNRPLAAINVLSGDSNTVLKDMAPDAWKNPVVSWLDYDGRLRENVVTDITILLENAAINSIILITVNAHFNSYRANGDVATRSRRQTAVGLLEQYLGSAAINSKYEPCKKLRGAFADSVKEREFPSVLSEALLTFMEHNTVKLARECEGERLKFLPLYNLHHKDGVDMITVGGVLTSEEHMAAWNASLKENLLLSEGTHKPVYRRLDMIPLTIKEKITLDACLPEPLGEKAYIEKARTKGIKLNEADMVKYRNVYRHFPLFVETPM